jgi:transcriptional regulator with XRE-family HTH domain
MARGELARFLRDRREGVRPADVGLPAGSRRRPPGLRREEVAALASMSVDYYVRLEQARGPRPSPRILQSLAGALRLAPAERAHLFQLAGVTSAAPAGPPNLARRRFLFRDQVLTTGHEEFGEIAVARLRAAADRYPRDAALAGLLAELRAGSAEFSQIWATNPVRAPGHRTKTMRHPELGPLRINCDVLTIPDDDQQVVFMTADPDTPAARALRHLAALAA